MAPQAVLGAACLGGRLGVRQPVGRSVVSHGITQARPLNARSVRPTIFTVNSLASRPVTQVRVVYTVDCHRLMKLLSD